MAKRKKLDLERIPETLEKIIAVIDREVDNLHQKEALSYDDSKNLISYASVLTSIYRDYRSEIKALKEEIKGKTKEELQELIKREAN